MSQRVTVSPAVLDAIADGVVERLAVRALPSLTFNGTGYRGEPLSRRQLDVLTLLADGLTNEEIGQRLGVHRDTIKNHVVAILTATGARDRTHAVAIGLRAGIIR